VRPAPLRTEFINFSENRPGRKEFRRGRKRYNAALLGQPVLGNHESVAPRFLGPQQAASAVRTRSRKTLPGGLARHGPSSPHALPSTRGQRLSDIKG